MVIENPTKTVMEVLGSVANFAGGIVLLVDALRSRKVVRVKKAGADFLEELRHAGVKELDLPVDEKGNPLHTPEDLELWLAEGTFKRSWGGFLLLLIGFGFELLSHVF
jgi:hypothetical protein